MVCAYKIKDCARLRMLRIALYTENMEKGNKTIARSQGGSNDNQAIAHIFRIIAMSAIYGHFHLYVIIREVI